MDVKFLRGLYTAYEALGEEVDSGTFYLTADDGENYNKLFIGSLEITSTTEVKDILTKIGNLESLSTKDKTSLVNAINEICTEIGNVSSLSTTAQNLAAAINELKTELDKISESEAVTVTSSSPEGVYKRYTINQGGEAVTENIDIDKISLSDSDPSEEQSNIAKIYTLKQGETVIGTINIPKDIMVTSGAVVTDNGETYIELILNNSEGTKIKINVKDLIDVYKAKEDAAEVQLKVEQDEEGGGQIISATIVDGAVTNAKLAADAVGTANIENGAVTNAKLAADAVGTANIENGAVSEDKIANSAVTADKIAENAVGTEEIAAGAVTTDELAENAVTTDKITDKSVTMAKLSTDVTQKFTEIDTALKNIDTALTWGKIGE